MTTESDRLLIASVRKNDQSAWVELDKRYRGRLTAYVRRRLKDHASVEDVVQERKAFIGFSNSLANYDDKHRDLGQTWLFTIAARLGGRPAAENGPPRRPPNRDRFRRRDDVSSLQTTGSMPTRPLSPRRA